MFREGRQVENKKRWREKVNVFFNVFFSKKWRKFDKKSEKNSISDKNRHNSFPWITFLTPGSILSRFWAPLGLLFRTFFGTCSQKLGAISPIGCSWVSVECSRVDFTSILGHFGGIQGQSGIHFWATWASVLLAPCLLPGLLLGFLQVCFLLASCLLLARFFLLSCLLLACFLLASSSLVACFLPASCLLACFLLASCVHHALLACFLRLSCLILAATKHSQQLPIHRAFRSLLFR